MSGPTWYRRRWEGRAAGEGRERATGLGSGPAENGKSGVGKG